MTAPVNQSVTKENPWAVRRYALAQALHRLRARPGLFFFAVLAAAAALLPPVLGALLAQHTWPLRIAAAPELSVFVAVQARTAELKALTRKLEALEATRSVRLVPRDQALAELTARSGAHPLPGPSLKVNPLPDVLIVQLREPIAAGRIDELATQIRMWSDVDAVVADTAWYRKWQQWQRLTLPLALGAAALALLLITWVVVMAVRVHATVDRDELAILTWVGATARFMRRPYIYLGAFTLTLSMTLALLAAGAVLGAARPQVDALLALYDLTLDWRAPAPELIAGLIAGAALIGGLLGRVGLFFAQKR